MLVLLLDLGVNVKRGHGRDSFESFQGLEDINKRVTTIFANNANWNNEQLRAAPSQATARKRKKLWNSRKLE